MKTELITNNLMASIEALLRKSTEVKIISAFFKKSSSNLFEMIPHKNVQLICGIDFFLTEPEAIDDYIIRYGHDNIKLFHDVKSTFHTKSFLIKTENKEYLVVGSSNLTSGGLNTNYEMSVIIEKEYQTNNCFETFEKYFKNLWSSQYSFAPDALLEKYRKAYNEAKNKTKQDNFNEELNDTFFRDKEPYSLNSSSEINTWIKHDTFGIGIITKVNENNAEIFFLKKGKQILGFNNKAKIEQIKNFSADLMTDIFSEDIVSKMKKDKNSFDGKKADLLEKRYAFYDKYRDQLKRSEMSPEEINIFFDECGDHWTMFEMKKNILAEKDSSFNELLKILNDKNKSYYEKYKAFLTKHDVVGDISGTGIAIVSALLNILYPDDCPVFNTASKKVFDFFNIQQSSVRGETDAEKYMRYMILCKIIKNFLNFQDLVEVDCYVGFIKDEKELI